MKNILLPAMGLVLAAASARGLAACAESSAPASEGPDSGPSPGVPEAGFPSDSSAGAPCDGGVPCGRPTSCAAAEFCEVDAGLDPRYSLFAVHGLSKNDVWTSGAAGTLMHYDGAAWTNVPTHRRETLHGLWVNTDDLWITSSGDMILHATREAGGALTLTPAPIAPGGTMYNGPYGAILASPDGGTLLVAGAFVSGVEGKRGELWSRSLPSGTEWISKSKGISGRSLNGLWSNGTDVWRVGNYGIVDRASAFWADESAPWVSFDGQTADDINAVTGFADGSVWLVGVRGDVRRYQAGPAPRFDVLEVPTTENLNAIWGTGPTNLWVVGAKGTILHYDGVKWTPKSVFHTKQEEPDLHAIWGSDERDVWVVGRGVILHINEAGAVPGVTQ